MLFRLNPLIEAGFHILIFGKHGFSSLTKATRVSVRAKGKRGPWTTIVFTKRHKTKAQKETALFKLLRKLSYAKDISKKKKKPKKAEPKKKKKKKLLPPKTVPKEEVQEVIREQLPKLKSKIKFFKPVITEKAITTRQGKQIYIKKYDFTLKREINFANGTDYEAPVANTFIAAAKEEFQKIYKKYGKKEYLVRLHHDYSNFVDYYDAFPKEKPEAKNGEEVKDKGFGGFSLNRQPFGSQKHVDMQFDRILPMFYLAAMSRYLNFANPSTEFNFSGFMVEVTIKKIKKK